MVLTHVYSQVDRFVEFIKDYIPLI